MSYATAFVQDLQREAAHRWPVWVVTLLGAALGAVYGYDFGLKLGGDMLLGTVMAANCVVFASIVVNALADRLLKLARR